MTPSILRDLLAQVAIVFGVAVGAWMIFVQPRAAELDRIESEIEQIRGSGGVFLTDRAVKHLAEGLQQIRERVQEIESRNRLAGDSSRLYDELNSVALEHGLHVQDIRPGGGRSPDDDDRPYTRTPIDVTVQGTFQQVARFCQAVTELEGFVRTTSLQLTPITAGGEQRLNARLGFDALSFRVPEVLTEMKGPSSADF